MRKILVVLLVLSVLGGAFAQGSWSLSGGGQVGVTLDFDPDDSLGFGDGVWNFNDAYGDWWPWTDLSNASLTAAYNTGGLSTGLIISTIDSIRLFASYDGGNYAFKAESYLFNSGGAGAWGTWGTGTAGEDYDLYTYGNSFLGDLQELWGWMKFVNGMIHLETAIISRETKFWTSADFWFDTLNTGVEGFADFFDNRSNYFITDVSFQGINFGIMLPDLFAAPMAVGDVPTPFASNLIDDVLQRLVFGVKFEMSPIEFAVQFNMENYGAYLGAKMVAGPITFSLGFEGEFDGQTWAAAGLGAAFSGAGFNAGVNFGLLFVEGQDLAFAIQPSFGYDVLPDNLRFEIGAEFGFANDNFDWKFVSELFWNFKGTGAGNFYWPMDTGIAISYLMQKDVFNRLSVVFKYGF